MSNLRVRFTTTIILRLTFAVCPSNSYRTRTIIRLVVKLAVSVLTLRDILICGRVAKVITKLSAKVSNVSRTMQQPVLINVYMYCCLIIYYCVSNAETLCLVHSLCTHFSMRVSALCDVFFFYYKTSVYKKPIGWERIVCVCVCVRGGWDLTSFTKKKIKNMTIIRICIKMNFSFFFFRAACIVLLAAREKYLIIQTPSHLQHHPVVDK